MKSCCFLYNPAANRSKADKALRQLELLLAGRGEAVAIRHSRSHGSIRQMAREAARKFDVVVACGGDGTARDVAIGLLGSKTEMGVIPMGSGNDFAKSLDIPLDIKEALTIIEHGQTVAVDAGQCNDHYFINTLGFGFDGTTNRIAGESTIKNGTLRYILAALKANFRAQPFYGELELDGNRVHSGPVLMLTVANGEVEGGNFKIAPGASNRDGKLEFVLIDPISRWVLPLLLPLFIWGKQTVLSQFTCRKGERALLKLDQPVLVHADGETIQSSSTTFDIRILKKALKVRVPQKLFDNTIDNVNDPI